MAGKPQPPKEYVREGSGRPSKFTPEIRDGIIHAISRRVPYCLAAEANGISEPTFYEWIKIGKQHLKDCIESEYTVFLKSVKLAEMQKVIEHTDKIADHVDKWQADAWILERRWHKDWSANAQLNELNQKLNTLLDGDSKNERQREKEDGQEG